MLKFIQPFRVESIESRMGGMATKSDLAVLGTLILGLATIMVSIALL